LKNKLFLVLALLLATACSDTNGSDFEDGNSGNVNANDVTKEPALSRLEFPKVKGGNSVVVIHTTNDSYGINYSVEWDVEKKSQRWSCYQLNSALLVKNTSRASIGYVTDPNLNYPHGDLIRGTGYDHGHMCPSADRLYSKLANEQTFYVTNLQPQSKAFNGSLNGSSAYKNDWSPWYQLESKVRVWGASTSTNSKGERVPDTLYVVKGGTIDDEKQFTLNGQLRIPKYFFVALLLKNSSGYKAVGFWMEHMGSYTSKVSIADCAVNIRKLEELTGIDFFCNLPDDVENKVETLPIENIKRAWSL